MLPRYYRTNTSACATNSRSGCGTTPSTTVIVAAAASATVVNTLGITTTAVWSLGSEKNINTITRT